MTNLVEEITVKSASLPSDLQYEVLDFVDSITGKGRLGKTSMTPFQSVRGILKRDMPDLEEDLAGIRKEMWDNFLVSRPNECGRERYPLTPLVSQCLQQVISQCIGRI